MYIYSEAFAVVVYVCKDNGQIVDANIWLIPGIEREEDKTI